MIINVRLNDCAFSFLISSQSRADLLTLGLAVTSILTGLVWLSIQPKSITPVKASLYAFCVLFSSTAMHTRYAHVHVKLNGSGLIYPWYWYQVDPQGVECQVFYSQLSEWVVSEIFWYSLLLFSFFTWFSHICMTFQWWVHKFLEFIPTYNDHITLVF